MGLNNMDPESLDITTVDVKLRDALSLTGKVDAVVGFDYTSVFNLIGNGAKLDDIELLYFSDMGFQIVRQCADRASRRDREGAGTGQARRRSHRRDVDLRQHPS